MPSAADQIEELKHAYVVLGVRLSASDRAIKEAYRGMVKRWHPDRYPSGTPEQADAALMTTTVNEAYAAIKNAPLRYYVDTGPPSATNIRVAGRPSWAGPGKEGERESLPRTDWIEYAVRFVCGAFGGVLLAFHFMMRSYQMPVSTMIEGAALVVLGCGFVAAWMGDDFWRSVFGRWWLWW